MQGATAIRQRPTASFSAAQCLIKPLSEPVESEAKTCCPPQKKENPFHGRSLFFSGSENAARLQSCYFGFHASQFQLQLGSGSPSVPSAPGDQITVEPRENALQLEVFKADAQHVWD